MKLLDFNENIPPDSPMALGLTEDAETITRRLLGAPPQSGAHTFTSLAEFYVVRSMVLLRLIEELPEPQTNERHACDIDRGPLMP